MKIQALVFASIVARANAIAVWQACGGAAGTSCDNGATCVFQTKYYSQCMPSELPPYSLCGKNSDTENWKFDHCPNGQTCQQTSQTEFRCQPGTTTTTGTSGGAAPVNPAWDPKTCTIESESQCDGQNWTYSTCCKDPTYACQWDPKQNVKRCMKATSTTSGGGGASTTTGGGGTTTTVQGNVNVWGQCGGDGWGVTCINGATCVRQSKWYAQCMPNSLPLDSLCAQNDPQGMIAWDFGSHCIAGTACKSVNWKESRCQGVPVSGGGGGTGGGGGGGAGGGYAFTNEPIFYVPTSSPLDQPATGTNGNTNTNTNGGGTSHGGGVVPSGGGGGAIVYPDYGSDFDLTFLRQLLRAIKNEIKNEINSARQEFYAYLQQYGAGAGGPVIVPGGGSKTPCKQISVEGDATYCVQEPLCSGSGDKPNGYACPVKGMTAVGDCWNYLKSYSATTGQCTAPVDATCQKIKTGAWGCVWTGATNNVAPPPAPIVPDCTKVSVVGDATYCIKGPICSGSGAQPAGTKCPAQNDMAVESCYSYLKSYSGDKKQCVAPKDATCQKIPSGAWGCVWADGASNGVVPATSTVASGPANVWEQCYGKSYSEQCKAPNTCVVFSPYYGQCLPPVLDWDGLCGQNDGKDIKWKYDHCPTGTTCQPVGVMDFRCKSGATSTTTTQTAQQSLAPAQPPSGPCTQVSVEGDATYCVQGTICSGAGTTAAGTACPKQGDVAVQDCHISLNSFTAAGKCVAPVDAQCQKIKTGAWGCVFPAGATPHPTDPPVPTPKPVYAQVWEQCAGVDWSKECFGATKCIKQSSYYSQCMPWLLDKGQLCGQNDGKDINWKFDACRSTSCLPFNAVDMRCQ